MTPPTPAPHGGMLPVLAAERTALTDAAAAAHAYADSLERVDAIVRAALARLDARLDEYLARAPLADADEVAAAAARVERLLHSV